jgi:signal transduction histidine kinase
MTAPDDGTAALLARLAAHRSVGSAPPEEHRWLVAHGTLHTYPGGTVVTAKGASAEHLLILLDGSVVIRGNRGAGSHKIFEWRAGAVGGRMPYSRGASPPNDAIAEEATDVLMIPRECFPELIRECPTVTATLVHAMVDRARMFTSVDLRDEKLMSLGKLAAGLAHELNNPASAVVRSAKLLGESLAASEASARRLGAAQLTDAQLAAIDEVRARCNATPAGAPLSAVARADREDAIADWLKSRGASETCAQPLAESAVTLEALDTLARTVSAEALDATLRWISAGCRVRALATEIEMAASRIHDLVGTVKGFTFMDRAPTMEPVDVRRGITDSLALLGSKRRAKSVEVTMDIPQDLPRVQAIGAELNQVWMNLLDNAFDAVGQGGHVTVRAEVERDRVLVRIIDDGSGIPPEIAGRIFDPFFTTKGVGKGTGLGLDIVRRLLQRQDGDVGVESRPGHTEFQVRLPTALGRARVAALLAERARK